MTRFSQEEYDARLQRLFVRFPSVQNVGFGSAYKPGLERMTAFDRALGRPSGSFRSLHVAGTNGKGSVASMLASVLSAAGLRTGLYTSPHLEDFRERMRIAEGGVCRMIPPGWGSAGRQVTVNICSAFGLLPVALLSFLYWATLLCVVTSPLWLRVKLQVMTFPLLPQPKQ